MISMNLGRLNRSRFHRRNPFPAKILTVILLLTSIRLVHGQQIKDLPTSQVMNKEVKMLNRRRIIGLGSSPPTCRNKCGRCRPCSAVHVPIQSNRIVLLEYYPEAWRCTCGHRFFMP